MEIASYLTQRFGIAPKTIETVDAIEKRVTKRFAEIEDLKVKNTYKVIDAFRSCNVCARHFLSSTGYGYSDDSREKLDELFAAVFNTESAIVSPHIASGTHAITVALFGLLRPLDSFLCVTGQPYDTLLDVIGITNKVGNGSLADFAVNYQQTELTADGKIDLFAVLQALKQNSKIKVVYFQRSRGYAWRPALACAEIEDAVREIKKQFPEMICVVDNCYGEFSEETEPSGADVLIGSLIKNPGAGIAPTGGYIAGKKKYIDLIAQRLTCPGIGREIGSYAGSYLPFYQGLYFAPHVVAEALKGAVLISAVFEKLGCEVYPKWEDPRPDITQSIRFGAEHPLLAFMRGIQAASPVDSAAVPYPWDMPGYDDQVVMAAGSFIQGSSIELSADGPMKEPYVAYVQGGLSYENVKLAVMLAIEEIEKLSLVEVGI